MKFDLKAERKWDGFKKQEGTGRNKRKYMRKKERVMGFDTKKLAPSAPT